MRRVLIAVLLIMVANTVLAQRNPVPRGMQRAERFEMAISGQYQNSESISGEEGTGIDFSSDWGLGVGLTWNFNNHFALSGDLVWGTPSYEATFKVDEPGESGDEYVTIRHRADFVTGQARATWHFLEGPITPFVEGILGYTYTDSNVADGPPSTGCWWDPWWGYICRDFWSTYDDSNWSYGFGLGLRWDVNREMGWRAAYTRRYIDLSNTSDPTFDIYSIDLLWRF